MQIGRWTQGWLTALAVTAGYYVCAVVGTVLSLPPSGFAIIWPATAFLIGALLIAPRDHWWLGLAGVVLAHFHLAAILQPHAPFVVVLTQIAGNIALALATVFAARRLISPQSYDSFGSVLAFIGIAGFIVPALVNPFVLAVHVLTGWTSDFWLSWLQWLVAGVFPTVTIPLYMVMLARGRARPPSWKFEAQEVAGVSLLLFGITYFAFGSAVNQTHWPALLLTPLPFLLWGSVRFCVPGAITVLLAFAAGIIAQALQANGPFAEGAPIRDIMSLQVFLITVSVPVILLAALMDERRRTSEELRHSQARMLVAAASTDTGLWQWDVRTSQLWVADHCRTMFGITDEAPNAPVTFLDAIHPEDRRSVAHYLRAGLTEADVQSPGVYRVVRGGETRWFAFSTHTDFDKHNKPILISGVFKDVTARVLAQTEAEELRQRVVNLQDEERRVIAEELHDSTAQHLVAVSLNLGNLKAKTPPEHQELIEEILKSVREATNEIRTFAYLLRPPQLDDEGLCDVLRQYVPGFARRTGLQAKLRVNPAIDALPLEQQRALLRIVQESLGNVHRHANATRVTVQLRCIDGNVHLVICDDGEGMRPESHLSDRIRLGVGIPAMTARVRQLGGRIDFSSAAATGTAIHVVIPFNRAVREAAH